MKTCSWSWNIPWKKTCRQLWYLQGWNGITRTIHSRTTLWEFGRAGFSPPGRILAGTELVCGNSLTLKDRFGRSMLTPQRICTYGFGIVILLIMVQVFTKKSCIWDHSFGMATCWLLCGGGALARRMPFSCSTWQRKSGKRCANLEQEPAQN